MFPGSGEAPAKLIARHGQCASCANRGSGWPGWRNPLAKLNVQVDVTGLGLNATDTVLVVRGFPPLGGKERVVSASKQAGGQMATALVTCQRLGLRARYIGKIGDDNDGRFQLRSLRREGLDLRYTSLVPRTPNQFGY